MNSVTSSTGPPTRSASRNPQSLGDNTASGGGQYANRIGLRGAGNVAYSWLNAKYPTKFLSSWSGADKDCPMGKTCANGYLSDKSGNAITSHGDKIPVMDYPALAGAFATLPAGVQIANETAVTRADAVPILYNLKITQDGLLSLSYSYNGGANFQHPEEPEDRQRHAARQLPLRLCRLDRRREQRPRDPVLQGNPRGVDEHLGCSQRLRGPDTQERYPAVPGILLPVRLDRLPDGADGSLRPQYQHPVDQQKYQLGCALRIDGCHHQDGQVRHPGPPRCPRKRPSAA